MKFKIKNLNWLAGRPVVILNEKDAKKLNVFVNDRVLISNSKKVYAVVDIFSKLVKKNEIGISHELSRILKLENKSTVEVEASEVSKASFLINKKLKGERLNQQEISYIVSEIVNNNLTEAEIAYFTAAEKMNGMSIKEITYMIRSMVQTGARLKFKGDIIADKHCIGGIAGNRTTPIVVSICACAGLTIPKTSSRAITSASGTADVVETVSNVDLSIEKIKEVVNKTGACLAWGGSLGLAPSDDKIIRVERLLNLDVEPQLISSILSKKISAGSKYILIDIPVGKMTKMKTLQEAESLGNKFLEVAKNFKLKLKVVYTEGSEPIANGVGPILEMLDVVAVLKNLPNAPQDLREKSLHLSTELLKLCGVKNARKKAEEILSSGKAYSKFVEILNAQNGKEDLEERIANLRLGKYKKIIRAKRSGEIVSISNQGINSLCRILGTPETKSAGAYIYKHVGKIDKGDLLITLYSESKTKLKDALKYYKEFKPIEIR